MPSITPSAPFAMGPRWGWCADPERGHLEGPLSAHLPVSAGPGEGHLAEPIADVQLARRGPLFMPLYRPWAGLGGGSKQSHFRPNGVQEATFEVA